MYNLIVGPCFESMRIDGVEVELTCIPYLDPSIKVPHMDTEHCNRIELDKERTFLYEEVLPGLYAFGLLHHSDDMHNGRPYIWSSNHNAFEEITGIKCDRVNHWAVAKGLAILPDGWIWSDISHSWITKPELIKYIHPNI
jgi:hypothetical protein